MKVPDLLFKWSKKCWSCYNIKEKSKLKSCVKCKLAKYCEKECQKTDWETHKLSHKELSMVQKVTRPITVYKTETE